MEVTTTVLYTFLLVFVGELGDKTQIATGTGALANRARMKVIFLSSASALTAVAGLTVFFASLIPESWLPAIQNLGGILLIGYGVYLFIKAEEGDNEDDNQIKAGGWKLFIAHFMVVFVAELGDKTQIATLAIAIENQHLLPIVFIASAAALITVTAITIWGVTKLPIHWIKNIQRIGALLMSAYGLYMISV